MTFSDFISLILKNYFNPKQSIDLVIRNRKSDSMKKKSIRDLLFQSPQSYYFVILLLFIIFKSKAFGYDISYLSVND